MSSFKAFMRARQEGDPSTAAQGWLQSAGDAPRREAAELPKREAAEAPRRDVAEAPRCIAAEPPRRDAGRDELALRADLRFREPRDMDEYLKWGFAEPPPGMAAAPPAETARRQREIAAKEREACCRASTGRCLLETPTFHMFGTVHEDEDPAELPLVSVVVPTYPKRHAYHALTLASFRAQRYPNLEMVVLDTGGPRSPAFDAPDVLADARVRYVHTADDALTLGEKRTELVKLAKGDIVAHFDDDNLCVVRDARPRTAARRRYGPRYLEVLLPHLRHCGGDMVSLNGWYNYLTWCDRIERVRPSGKMTRGESFLHSRRMKTTGALFEFPRIELGEDVAAEAAAVHAVDDDVGLFFHVEHGINSSPRVVGDEVRGAAPRPAADLLAMLDVHRPLLRAL
jgi:hypothetical protein